MSSSDSTHIYLRPHEMRDKDAILAGANEPESQKLTGTQTTFTMPQIEAYIANNSTDETRAGWVICTSEDEVVGEVVINEIDALNRSANIRIALFHPRYFGVGYGTEAIRRALDYGFTTLKLHRISLSVFDFNPRAIHVYEKIGFKREGILRDTLLWEGEYHNEIVMSILTTEWRV
jgi:RimJ/RimL family protein N-acetyltransferase